MQGSWHDLGHVLGTLTQLVNSGPDVAETDALGDLDSLHAFIDSRTISEDAEPSEAELDALHALRRQLRAIVVASTEESRADMVNALLSRATITPRVVDHDGLGRHLHYFPPYAPLTEHLLADCAMALAHLLAADESPRLRICARPGCGRALFDTTKNRSRIYCDSATCGNRLHSAAYRARQAKAG